MTEQNGERLQKALSRAGVTSRRGGEELIMAGRVKVNGKIVTELGTKIDPAKDKVMVDDEPVAVKVSATPQKIYIMLNKPAGYLSTVSDPQGRPTIMDLLDTARLGRLYPVGRLDADTEGLLILTNDGAFANALSHPRFGVEKEYVALVEGIIAMKDIERLRRGVPISVEDNETGERGEHLTKPARVDLIRHEGSNSLVRFILKEGKKRQIRLMADAVDHPVIELRRVRQGPVKLGDLASGKFRNLSKQEVKDLQEASKPGTVQEEAPVPTQAGRGRGPASSSPVGRPPGRPAGRPSENRGRGGGGTVRPTDRVEPFKTPGSGRSGPPRRFGERNFEEAGFNPANGNRRFPTPNRGPRPGPARFERDRDENLSGRPPAPARRGGRPEQGNPSDFERSRDRTGSNFDRSTPRPERRNYGPDAERPDRDRTERGHEPRTPFRGGPGRQNPGPGRDRDNEGPAPYRSNKPGGERFSPSRNRGGGAPPPASRRGRPNPNGFVPAAERSAPTPGRGRPPSRPARSNQATPEAPNRGNSGPARNRPTGQRPSGPNRQGGRG